MGLFTASVRIYFALTMGCSVSRQSIIECTDLLHWVEMETVRMYLTQDAFVFIDTLLNHYEWFNETEHSCSYLNLSMKFNCFNPLL